MSSSEKKEEEGGGRSCLGLLVLAAAARELCTGWNPALQPAPSSLAMVAWQKRPLAATVAVPRAATEAASW